MNILEFRVAEFTRINDSLNRVCLDGGFKDSKARVVFNTREKFKVGQILTVPDAPPVMARPNVAPPESKPAKAAEPAPDKEKKKKFNF